MEDVEKLKRARRLISEVIQNMEPEPPPDQEVVHVHAGDDLKALVESNPEDTVYQLDEGFVQDVLDWTINKSVTIRATPDTTALRGNIRLLQAVAFEGLNIQGVNPDYAVVICANWTTLTNTTVTGGDNGSKRGVEVNAENITIDGCKIVNIWHTGYDTQAVAAWTGTKNLHIMNSTLEATGESFILGGADSASENDIPQDVLIEGCTFKKNPDWKGNLSVKNLLELKCAKRVEVRDCDMMNSWTSGQTGYAIVLTVRNQDGPATWSTIEDVTIEDIRVSNVGAGFQILGTDYTNPSQIMNNVLIRNVTFTNMNMDYQGAAIQIYISGGPKNITFDGIEVSNSGWLNSAITFDPPPCTGLVFKNCKLMEGDYGIRASDTALGTPTLDVYAPGYVWENMTIVKGTSGRNIPYPEGTTVV